LVDFATCQNSQDIPDYQMTNYMDHNNIDNRVKDRLDHTLKRRPPPFVNGCLDASLFIGCPC